MIPKHAQSGHCWVSGEPIFEIAEQVPIGKPLAGQPRRLGKPLPAAVRTTVVRMNGTITDLSHHADYPIDADNIRDVWASVIEASGLYASREYREKAKQSGLSLGMQSLRMETITASQLLDLIHNPALGVLCTIPWQEIIDGRA